MMPFVVPAVQSSVLFEVVTIKPSAPIMPAQAMAGQVGVGLTVSGSRVSIKRASLAELIARAYDVKLYQVTGPTWIKSEKFDVQANMPQGATESQLPEMLRATLTERFGITLHKDTKQQDIYALVVGKDGPRLKSSAPGTEPSTEPTGTGMNANGMHFEYAHMTTAALADRLARFAGRPVVDMTNLTGSYDVSFDISMTDFRSMMMAGIGMSDGPAEPAESLFASMQKLGLKLESRKISMELLVIDHASKSPTAN
jgi:uncharacterized protein (TIGR03435 family)